MKTYTYSEIKKFARQINDKEIAETKEILMRQNDFGSSVAHELARNSNITNWSTEDKDILLLQNKNRTSVAYWLAKYHPTWTTDDLEVLSLYSDYWEQTVEDILVRKNKI